LVALVTVVRVSCAYALWPLGTLVARGRRFFPDPTGKLITMNNQACKQRVANPADKNSAQRYLFAIAPVGADLVLLFGLEVLLWMA
jgi:hypothetical protein